MLLLTNTQRQELAHFLLEYSETTDACSLYQHFSRYAWQDSNLLTEIREGDLYLCLEQRLVTVREQEICLTVKEFDILFLLASNPKRVFTYELIVDLVWKEDYTYYSRKAINNHICNLRKKLKIDPGDPDYIKSVTGIGYKFSLP